MVRGFRSSPTLIERQSSSCLILMSMLSILSFRLGRLRTYASRSWQETTLTLREDFKHSVSASVVLGAARRSPRLLWRSVSG